MTERPYGACSPTDYQAEHAAAARFLASRLTP